VESDVRAFHEKYGVEPDVDRLAQQYGRDELIYVMRQVIRADAVNAISYLNAVLKDRKEQGESITSGRRKRKATTFANTLAFQVLTDYISNDSHQDVEVTVAGTSHSITKPMIDQWIAKVRAGVTDDNDRFWILLTVNTLNGHPSADLTTARQCNDVALIDKVHTYYMDNVWI